VTRPMAISHRIRQAADRLAWGLLDWRDRLITHGWWPARRVVAIDSQGGCWAIRGQRALPLARARTARAILLRADQCLWGRLDLPAMPRRDVPHAVQEALWSQAPLPLPQMACAWSVQPSADGGWQVPWGLAPLDTLTAVRRARQVPDRSPAYLLRADGHACMVRDEAWMRQQRLRPWWDALGLLALAVVAASTAVLALVPAALQRQGVVGAMQQLRALEPRAAPVRQQLDALRQQATLLQSLRDGHSAAVPVAAILDTLAAALPDDTVLDRVDISGRDIRITGLTPNATALLSRLAGNGALSDLRAPTAAVRDGTSNKERFTFELRWKGGNAS